MSYIYRMIDKNYNCLYLGYTGREFLSSRMDEHFSSRGHLPKECYDSVARIDCRYFENDYLAKRNEVKHIKRYDPVYNTVHKRNNKKPMKIVTMTDGWEVFSELQEMNEIPGYVKPMQYAYLGAVSIFGIASMIFMILQM